MITLHVTLIRREVHLVGSIPTGPFQRFHPGFGFDVDGYEDVFAALGRWRRTAVAEILGPEVF
jgi:hypothetical protein